MGRKKKQQSQAAPTDAPALPTGGFTMGAVRQDSDEEDKPAAPQAAAPFQFSFAPNVKKGDDSDDDSEGSFNPKAEKAKRVKEFTDKLTEAGRATVDQLSALQKQRDDLYAAYQTERRQLELKYETQYQPLYAKRSEVLTAEPTTLDKFWLTAMKNHPMLADNIQDRDEEALAALIDLSVVSDEKGFTITFVFKPNPFFSDRTLTKRYELQRDDEGDLTFAKAVGCEIQWAQGKNLTQKLVTKKQRHKSGKGTRTVTRAEPCDSFFNFFAPPDPEADAGEDEDEDMEELVEADFEMGEELRTRIIPNAVGWFTGAAVPEEWGMADDFDMDDDDDDEEIDSDDEPPVPKGKGGKGGKGPQQQQGAAPGGAQQQQCQQGQQ